MYSICLSFCLFAGLIHANHGGNITDYLLNQVKDATSDVSYPFSLVLCPYPKVLIMSPPCKGRETYCFSPCLCPSICLSVTKLCPLYNLITVTDISMKLHTFVKHFEMMCHAQEP